MLGFRVSCLLAFTVGSASATLITTSPGTGTITTFTATGLTVVPGPVVVDGITVSGNPNVTYGDAPYGLGEAPGNGRWTGFSFVGTNSPVAVVTFNLGANFGYVGGFMNYTRPLVDATNPIITALAADGTTVLETYNLETNAAIVTPDGTNQGAFRGISRAQQDIRFLRIEGDYILTHTLEVGEQVPEPSTMALLALGAVFMALRSRKLAA